MRISKTMMRVNPQGSIVRRNPAKPMQNVRLIVETLIPQWQDEAKEFAKKFENFSSIKDLTKELWKYCRKNIKYKLDPDGVELIRSPLQTLKDAKKGVDCEDFTALLSCVLLILKVFHLIRVVNYGNGWQHIYVVVGSENIILDPVMPVFNYEDPYVMKADFAMLNMGLGRLTIQDDILIIPKQMPAFMRMNLEKYLDKNPNKLIVLYHASSEKNQISKKGILAVNRNNSPNSDYGYTYFSIDPEIAINYAKKKYPQDKIVLYEVVLPVSMLEADKNNLKKVGGKTLVDSITQRSCSVQVKGNIPNLFITKLNGLKGLNYNPDGFIDFVAESTSGAGLKRTYFETKAKDFGILDPREVKELIELAIVNKARGIIEKNSGNVSRTFDELVRFYEKQVLLSFRNSTSIMLQQYSTPVPIAYLMGVYCGIHQFTKQQMIFEPSAGNGVLLIAGKQQNAIVNEIDDLRRKNLSKGNYQYVDNADASTADIYGTPNTIAFRRKMFDAVLTNPPFAKIDPVTFKGYVIKDLDHLMTIRALDCMKDDGKAAIIFGGHTRYDELGRIASPKDRYFLNYLYSQYNVDDVINVDGALYAKMGASANIRIVLINGRKEIAHGVAPIKQMANSDIVLTFEDLFNRIMGFEYQPYFVEKAQNDKRILIMLRKSINL